MNSRTLDILKYVLEKFDHNTKIFNISEDKKIFAYFYGGFIHVLDVYTKKEFYKCMAEKLCEKIILNKDGSCILFYDHNFIHIIKNNYKKVINVVDDNLLFHPFNKNLLFTNASYYNSLFLYDVKHKPVVIDIWSEEGGFTETEFVISPTGNYLYFKDKSIDISKYNYVKNFKIILKKFFYKDILEMIKEFL